MELLKQELKKIWNPIVIIIIAVLGGIYFFLFASFYVQYFNNGPDAEANFALCADWSKKYGTTLEVVEREQFDLQLAEEKVVFAKKLANYEEAKQHGISDWESFVKFRETYYNQTAENGNQADMAIEQVIWKIIGGTNYYTIENIQRIAKEYDNLAKDIPTNLNYDGSPESDIRYQKIINRVEEIKASDNVHGYLPNSFYDSTGGYINRLAVWVLLSVILLLSPTIVRDKLHRVQSIQWSSKTGRKILRVQYTAAGISALVLTMINLFLYAIPFIRCGVLAFKDFPLFSFQKFRIPWFDWTYAQYLLVMAAVIILLGCATGGLSVFLSQYSGNYVAMLLKAIPLFGIAAFISIYFITNKAFFIGNKANELFGIAGVEFLIVGILMCISVLARVLSCKRQKKAIL